MSVEDLEEALEWLVRREAKDAVARGRATVEVRDESSRGGPSRVISVMPIREAACPVTVLAQSDREVSFFVGPPHDPESMTVDLYDRDREALLKRVREYFAAVLAGGIEVESRQGSSSGRATFVLADGERVAHTYNHLLWRPRLRRWTVHRFESY